VGIDTKTALTALAKVIGIALAAAIVTKGDIGSTVSAAIGAIVVLLIDASIRAFRNRRGPHTPPST